MSKYYTEKKVDISHLEPWEKDALEYFKDASKIIGEIFDIQKGDGTEKASFYPKDATIEEVSVAAELDTKILNQFTIVKRDDVGKLYAVGYYEEYKDQLNEIINLLNKAADICQDLNFKKYLLQLVKDIKDDSYAESEKLYVELKDNNLEIHLGPLEKYVDKFFGVKRAFISSVRILEPTGKYEHIKDYVEVLGNIYPQSPIAGDKPELKHNIRFDNVIVEAGWQAYLIAPFNIYPKHAVLEGYSNHTAKSLVYINNIIEDPKFDLTDEIKVFSDESRKQINWDNEVINNDKVKYYALLGIAHAIIRYEVQDVDDRFGVYSDAIRETYSKVLAIKAASVQVLKGLEEPESYMMQLLLLPLFAMRLWNYGKNKGVDYQKTFVSGYTAILNYFFENGAIFYDEKDKLSFNFEKIYAALDLLNTELTDLIQNGNEKQAEEFLDRYSSTKLYEKYFG